MGLLDVFVQNRKKSSANIAKERLQILIAHDREKSNAPADLPDYLPELKQELIKVISKYVSVEEHQVEVQQNRVDDCDVMELSITFSPE